MKYGTQRTTEADVLSEVAAGQRCDVGTCTPSTTESSAKDNRTIRQDDGKDARRSTSLVQEEEIGDHACTDTGTSSERKAADSPSENEQAELIAYSASGSGGGGNGEGNEVDGPSAVDTSEGEPEEAADTGCGL